MRIHVGDFRIAKEEREAINEVLDSGKISEGEKVNEFERAFAEFIGTKYSIAVCSGTSALIAGLTALKYYEKLTINANPKVITTPITYTATSNAIVLTGFKPVYVDIDKETFGITPDNIKAHLEQADDPSKYSLILPVHLMGYPCDMDGINKVAKIMDYKHLKILHKHMEQFIKEKKQGLSLYSPPSLFTSHIIYKQERWA